MIPLTPEELRETLPAWPVADLRRAIYADLPELDDGLVALLADWLAASEIADPTPPLGREQVEAIWRAIQRRAS